MNWSAPDQPTRAINIAAEPKAVLAICAKKEAAVSAIETLPAGGTHVVMVTLGEADIIRDAFKDKLLPHNTARTPLRQRASWDLR
jgi:hypothetical protein